MPEFEERPDRRSCRQPHGLKLLDCRRGGTSPSLVVVVTADRLSAHLLAIALQPGDNGDTTVMWCAPDEPLPLDAGCILIDHRIAAHDPQRLLSPQTLSTVGCPTVVFAVPNDPDTIISYIEMGAKGYLCINDPPERLREVMTAMWRGEAELDPEIAARLMQRLVQLHEMRQPATLDVIGRGVLTLREREVLDLMGTGSTNQEIADTLDIKPGTVKNHVHQVLKKLMLRSRREAASYLANEFPGD